MTHAAACAYGADWSIPLLCMAFSENIERRPRAYSNGESIGLNRQVDGVEFENERWSAEKDHLWRGELTNRIDCNARAHSVCTHDEMSVKK